MTIEEIKKLDTPFITPAVAAQIMKSDPNSIRVMAKRRPELLGFPVSVVGNRVKIPRKPFLDFWEGENA